MQSLLNISQIANVSEDISKVVALITLVISGIWSLIVVVTSYRKSKIDQNSERLFKLIREFKDEDRIVRLATINCIRNNIQDVYMEMVLITAIEKDDMIKNMLRNMLIENAKTFPGAALDLNHFYVGYYSMILSDSGEEDMEGQDLITNDEMKDVFRNNTVRIDNQISFKYRQYKGSKIKFKDEVESYLLLTSELIAKGLSNKKNYREREIENILIACSNLHSNKWRNYFYINSLFKNNVMRHMRISKTKFINCQFCRDSLYGSTYTKVIFKSGKFMHCVLDDSIYHKVKMLECTLYHCSFNNARFKQLNMTSIILDNIRMFDLQINNSYIQAKSVRNCIMKAGLYENVTVKEGLWKDNEIRTTFKNCIFENLQLFTCKLTKTKFVNCNFTKNIVRGCDLTSCLFENCTFHGEHPLDEKFENVPEKKELTGNESSGNEFSGVEFTEVSFIHCKGMNNIRTNKVHNWDKVVIK